MIRRRKVPSPKGSIVNALGAAVLSLILLSVLVVKVKNGRQPLRLSVTGQVEPQRVLPAACR